MPSNNIILNIENEDEIDFQSEVQIIRLDGKEIGDKGVFIEKFYSELGCPGNFGKNWDAFWDTITDNQFWVKMPLVLIIKNYNHLFGANKNDRCILSDILIDLIKQKRQKYCIYILS